MKGPKSALSIILLHASGLFFISCPSNTTLAMILVGGLEQAFVAQPMIPVTMENKIDHQAIPYFQFHQNGSIIKGDNQYSCMSVDKYHVCPKHYLIFYVMSKYHLYKLNIIQKYIESILFMILTPGVLGAIMSWYIFKYNMLYQPYSSQPRVLSTA